MDGSVNGMGIGKGDVEGEMQLFDWYTFIYVLYVSPVDVIDICQREWMNGLDWTGFESIMEVTDVQI